MLWETNSVRNFHNITCSPVYWLAYKVDNKFNTDFQSFRVAYPTSNNHGYYSHLFVVNNTQFDEDSTWHIDVYWVSLYALTNCHEHDPGAIFVDKSVLCESTITRSIFTLFIFKSRTNWFKTFRWISSQAFMCSWSHIKPLETHAAHRLGRRRQIGSYERSSPNMMPVCQFRIEKQELYSKIVDGDDVKVA